MLFRSLIIPNASLNDLSLDMHLQLTPQTVHPWIELSLILEVMLVVSESHLVYEFSAEVKHPLSQLFSHGIELLVA